jgi:hypothetical protein
MSKQYYTAKQRADKRITGDEYKAMQKVGLALIGQIQKILATAQTVMDSEK